ncbi:MAG: hypothetical protein J6W27_02320 [Alphaproteobacteria bacterium]|nr:hypothetical protein [Alphaproteobacteria bacterium]
MIEKINTYWPIYKNLEKEVVALSYNIMFSDDLLNTYSVKIADLIFRCSAELESLYKDLYRNETNNEPQDVGTAVRYLDEHWRISQKAIFISCPNFYFSKFKPFKPFDYVNGDTNDFYSAYNAIKHDRVKNIAKANLNILIRIMGALFVLNVYYKNQKFNINRPHDITSFDRSFGSEIFTIKMFDGVNAAFALRGTKDDFISSDELLEYIYLGAYQQNTYKGIITKCIELSEEENQFIINSKEYKEFVENGIGFPADCNDPLSRCQYIGGSFFYNKLQKTGDIKTNLLNSPEYKSYCVNNKNYPANSITTENLKKIVYAVGGFYYLREVFQFKNKEVQIKSGSGMELVLNKGQDLYPDSWRKVE